MGLFKGKNSSQELNTSPSIKKYNYRQYLETQSKPSDAVLNTASRYSDKVASSAALQVELENSKKDLGSRKRERRPRACNFTRALIYLLSLLQIAGAAAVIGITAGCIDKEIEGNDGEKTNALCYTLNSSVNTCTYTYWACGISIALSLFILFMNLCCIGRRKMCCVSIEAILNLVGTAWWIAAGTVSVISSDNADSQGLGEKSCRIALWITCYVTGGIFGASFLVSSCGCCFRCCRDSSYDYDA